MIPTVKPKIRVPARTRATAGFTAGEAMALRQFMAGQYIGARSDRNALKNWNPLVGSADGDTIGDLQTLRARSRDLVRNAPLAGGAVATVVTNTVGTGLRLRSTIDRDFLGLTEEQADAWQNAAERIYRTWAESTHCDLTMTQTFAGLQDLAFRSTLESGDVFVIRRHKPRPGAILGLTLQIVEADRVSTPDGKQDGPRLVDGVEIDGDGAPVRYWVRSGFPDQTAGWVRDVPTWDPVPAFGASGARVTLHLFRRLRPGLNRGAPYLAPIIEPLKQLDRYSEAEIMAAVVSALFTVFVKTPSGQGLGDLEGAVPATGGYALGTGAILDLGPGEEVEIANPGRPNTAFDPFVQAVLRQIGVALELPFEILVKHFTASYSASKAAVEQAFQFFRTRRAWLEENLCDPVYEWVITEAILRGYLDAPGFLDDPMIRAAYLGTEWIGPKRITLDPLKEAKADEVLIGLKVKTRSEVCVETTGVDLDRKLPQIRKEEALFPPPAPAAGIGHNGGPPLDGQDGQDDAGQHEEPEE